MQHNRLRTKFIQPQGTSTLTSQHTLACSLVKPHGANEEASASVRWLEGMLQTVVSTDPLRCKQP